MIATRIINMSAIFVISAIAGWLTWPIIGFEEGPSPNAPYILGRALSSTVFPILITYLVSAAYIKIKKKALPNNAFLSILWIVWLVLIINSTMGDYFYYIEKTTNAI